MLSVTPTGTGPSETIVQTGIIKVRTRLPSLRTGEPSMRENRPCTIRLVKVTNRNDEIDTYINQRKKVRWCTR